jgi:hypothetical protein
MNDLDVLTLQLLSSKKRYNQYLENAQPNKANEIQEFYGKIRKYKSRIRQTMEKYLENPETQTTTDVDDVIETCFKTLITHYEILNREQKSYLNDYDETDSTEDEDEVNAKEEEDEDEDGEVVVTPKEVVEPEPKKPTQSFWGNKITKTPSTTLDGFIRKKKDSN